jgi:hypothetical protein
MLEPTRLAFARRIKRPAFGATINESYLFDWSPTGPPACRIECASPCRRVKGDSEASTIPLFRNRVVRHLVAHELEGKQILDLADRNKLQNLRLAESTQRVMASTTAPKVAGIFRLTT